MILESNLKTKLLIIVTLFCYSSLAIATPELLPPGEASYVTDPVILNKLNLGPDGEPIWCYSNLANSLIITSADREREKCTLSFEQKIRVLKINHRFEVEQLNIQINSLNKKHNELVLLKDQQIEELSEAAQLRPNDYTIWWATGGVLTGVLTTLAIMFAVK